MNKFISAIAVASAGVAAAAIIGATGATAAPPSHGHECYINCNPTPPSQPVPAPTSSTSASIVPAHVIECFLPCNPNPPVVVKHYRKHCHHKHVK